MTDHCRIQDCQAPVFSRTLCTMHLRRWERATRKGLSGAALKKVMLGPRRPRETGTPAGLRGLVK